MLAYIEPAHWLVLGAMLVSVIVNILMRVTVHHWFKQSSHSSLTGVEFTRKLLAQHDLDTSIDMNPKRFSDLYDPETQTLQLSKDVYEGTSISALSIASHEVGHLIQEKEKYKPLLLQDALFIPSNIGFKIAPVLIVLGLFVKPILYLIGLLLFTPMTIYYILNILVEHDASRRAKQFLVSEGIQAEHMKGVHRVLDTALWVYIGFAILCFTLVINGITAW